MATSTMHRLALVALGLAGCGDGTLQPSRSPGDPSNPRAPEAAVVAPPDFGDVTAPSATAAASSAPIHHHHPR